MGLILAIGEKTYLAEWRNQFEWDRSNRCLDSPSVCRLPGMLWPPVRQMGAWTRSNTHQLHGNLIKARNGQYNQSVDQLDSLRLERKRTMIGVLERAFHCELRTHKHTPDHPSFHGVLPKWNHNGTMTIKLDHHHLARQSEPTNDCCCPKPQLANRPK